MRFYLMTLSLVAMFCLGQVARGAPGDEIEAVNADILNSKVKHKSTVSHQFLEVANAPLNTVNLGKMRETIRSSPFVPSLRRFLMAKFSSEYTFDPKVSFLNASLNPDLYIMGMEYLDAQKLLGPREKSLFSANLWNILYDEILKAGANKLDIEQAHAELAKEDFKLYRQIELHRKMVLENSSLDTSLLDFAKGEKSQAPVYPPVAGGSQPKKSSSPWHEYFFPDWKHILEAFLAQQHHTSLDFLSDGISEHLGRLAELKGEDIDLGFKLNIYKKFFPEDHRFFDLALESTLRYNRFVKSGKTLLACVRFVLEEITYYSSYFSHSNPDDQKVRDFLNKQDRFKNNIDLNPEILLEAQVADLVFLPDLDSFTQFMAEAALRKDFFKRFDEGRISMITFSLANTKVSLDFKNINLSPETAEKLKRAIRHLKNLKASDDVTQDQAESASKVIRIVSGEACNEIVGHKRAVTKMVKKLIE